MNRNRGSRGEGAREALRFLHKSEAEECLGGCTTGIILSTATEGGSDGGK